MNRYFFKCVNPRTGNEIVYEYTGKTWKDALESLKKDEPGVKVISCMREKPVREEGIPNLSASCGRHLP